MLYNLTETTPDLAPLVGGKAAALGALCRAGLPVPRGVVLLPGCHDLDEAWDRVGAPLVAVRSSATAEDLAGAAAAGQHESYLRVDRAGLAAAVEACRASLWGDRAMAYRRRRGIADAGLAMAVVVQAMVEAEVSGVMFTAHPVTGRLDQVVVEVVPGDGEALVSGRAIPDHWELDAETGAVLLAEAPRELLTPAQLDGLVDLGRRVQALQGAPQDIEWALQGGQFHLLQARPITTL